MYLSVQVDEKLKDYRAERRQNAQEEDRIKTIDTLKRLYPG